jgi:hypothetical protein
VNGQVRSGQDDEADRGAEGQNAPDVEGQVLPHDHNVRPPGILQGEIGAEDGGAENKYSTDCDHRLPRV